MYIAFFLLFFFTYIFEDITVVKLILHMGYNFNGNIEYLHYKPHIDYVGVEIQNVPEQRSATRINKLF